MALIICKDLTLGYENTRVAEHLSFTVPEGAYLCIVGENGSGKSTLMKTLLGLRAPLAGSIAFGDGLRKNEIGDLPQQIEGRGEPHFERPHTEGRRVAGRRDDLHFESVEDPREAQTHDDHPMESRPRQAIHAGGDEGSDLGGLQRHGSLLPQAAPLPLPPGWRGWCR